MRSAPCLFVLTALAACCALPGGAVADVLITEIMFAPASTSSDDLHTDWIEIWNSGPAPVDISGYAFEDASGDLTGTFGAAAGGTLTIDSGEVLVFYDITVEPTPGSPTVFKSAWGASYESYGLTGWKTTGGFFLPEAPAGPYAVKLKTGSAPLDVSIEYESDAPWPTADGVGSIALKEVFPGMKAGETTAPEDWELTTGLLGAFSATPGTVYGSTSVGTPGTVPLAAVPEPSSMALLGALGALAALRRRRQGERPAA